MSARKAFQTMMAFTLTAAFAALPLGLFAQVTPPARVNYQGVLRDASGNPLSGLQTMTFRFYDAASGGTVLWEETYSAAYPPQVTVSTGLFTVALGDAATHRTNGSETLFPNVFALHGAVYLAVAVGLDAEMTPRIQVVSAPFAENCDTLDGKHAADFVDVASSGNFLNTSSTPQTKAGKLTLAGSPDYGIDASGPTAGGSFKDSNNSGYAYVGYGDRGIDARGNEAGGFFGDSDNSGYAYVGYGDYGIYAFGNTMGGLFGDWSGTGYAYVGVGDTGIEASGNAMGGYFQSANATGYAYVGYGDYGIKAVGNTTGGNFQDFYGSGSANVGYGDYGIYAGGYTAGGYFQDTNGTSYAYVGYDIYKIFGSGTVSFVQNHPTEKDKVIVYACPEGDEVATYTRGSAKLVNGEARVQLGETFKWVTNPDIGLTAHLTPHGRGADLYVDSLSTSDLVVKSDDPKAANVVFDYLVYGLRIGFEESSIVQEKQQESFIPSFNNHRERYAKYPELRAFNALERFKTMDSSVRGVEPASMDLSRAKALHDAVHEYDPATDPPVDKLLGHGPGKEPGHAAPDSARPAFPSSMATGPSGNGGILAPAASSGPAAGAMPVLPVDADGNFYGKSFRPASSDFASSLPVCGPVEAGDILVTDANHPGLFCRSLVPNDPGVVGVVAGEPGVLLGSGPKGSEPAMLSAPVATSGIVKAKVDAGYGPIALNDLLVVSPTPGHAMRADNPAQGTVIGKALEPFATGTGTIKVLVMLR